MLCLPQGEVIQLEVPSLFWWVVDLCPHVKLHEPDRVYQEPDRVYQEPGRVYQEQDRVYQEPGRVYQEPGRVHQQQELEAVWQLE